MTEMRWHSSLRGAHNQTIEPTEKWCIIKPICVEMSLYPATYYDHENCYAERLLWSWIARRRKEDGDIFIVARGILFELEGEARINAEKWANMMEGS